MTNEEIMVLIVKHYGTELPEMLPLIRDALAVAYEKAARIAEAPITGRAHTEESRAKIDAAILIARRIRAARDGMIAEEAIELSRLHEIQKAAQQFVDAGSVMRQMNSTQWDAYIRLKALFHGGEREGRE